MPPKPQNVDGGVKTPQNTDSPRSSALPFAPKSTPANATAQKHHERQKPLTEKMTPEAVIAKLEREKKSFEAETSMLREEMQLVRKQLEAFQNMVAQQVQQKQESQRGTIAVESKVAVEKKPALPTPVTDSGNKLWFMEWQVPEEFDDELEVPKVESQGDKSEQSSHFRTQNYWKQALELGNPESEDSNEEHESFDEDTGAVELPSQKGDVKTDPLHSTPPDAVSASAVSERGVEPRETNDADQLEGDDLARDIAFVQQLLQKYQKELNGSLVTPQKKSPMITGGRDFNDKKDHLNTNQALVQIENMKDVDSSYSQRQIAMDQVLKEFESGKFNEPQGLPPSSPKKADSVTSRTRNTEKKSVILPPPVKDTTKTKPQPGSPSSHRRSHRSIRFMKHRRFMYRDEQGENKSSRANDRTLKGNQDEVKEDSRTNGTTKQQQQLKEKTKSSSLAQGVDPTTPGTGERVLSEPFSNMSEHSRRSEADDIEFSTSVHNTVFWSHSISQQSEQPSTQVTPKPLLPLPMEPISSSDSSDVMDGIEDMARKQGQHTPVSEIREVSQIGKGGVTYKILVKDTPTDRVLAPRLQQHRHQKAPESKILQYEQLTFRGHAGEYKHLAQRLI